MSYPPDPNNPYGQPQQPGYGYPQQAPPAAGYGYPQQPPQAPGYGVPQQPAYGYAPVPGTIQANNGYINVAHLGTVKIATMGQRFAARLIDGLFFGALYAVFAIFGVLGALGVAKDQQDCSSKLDYSTSSYSGTNSAYYDCIHANSQAATGWFVTSMLLFGLFMAVGLLYEWLLVAFTGATLGKFAMGLRVVKENNGQVPGLGGGFIRFIIPSVGSLLCGLGQLLVYLSPFFDNSGKLQGWHDRAAGTLVVKK
ncbi:RDD family protein [Kitasatospora sp. NBC_01560]|uniref:RDD family protein n=1 Tax=Kitasatospora sp. NBC_01560 TaxID=2975965 RepID=UPI00387093BD